MMIMIRMVVVSILSSYGDDVRSTIADSGFLGVFADRRYQRGLADLGLAQKPSASPVSMRSANHLHVGVNATSKGDTTLGLGFIFGLGVLREQLRAFITR
jgi:hypothetical protein